MNSGFFLSSERGSCVGRIGGGAELAAKPATEDEAAEGFGLDARWTRCEGRGLVVEVEAEAAEEDILEAGGGEDLSVLKDEAVKGFMGGSVLRRGSEVGWMGLRCCCWWCFCRASSTVCFRWPSGDVFEGAG